MKNLIGVGLLIACAITATGCANVSITSPADQTTVSMPTAVTVNQSGIVDFGVVTLDGTAISQQGNYPPTPLRFVPPGTHTLAIGAKDDKWHTDISKSVTFTVSPAGCPLCYTCPAPTTVNPVTGQCCTNAATTCDRVFAFNFGPTAMGTPECQKALAPGSQQTFADQDCLTLATTQLGAATTNGWLAAAVSFSPTASGALSQIQVPIGVSAGAPTVTAFVTTDAAGGPGTVLETIPVASVRQQPFPVVSPMHIFSVGHPALNAGTRYWLVISVGAAAATRIAWNKTALFDVSTPGMTTLLVTTNGTTNPLAGPWTAVSNLQELRPAFEIDVR